MLFCVALAFAAYSEMCPTRMQLVAAVLVVAVGLCHAQLIGEDEVMSARTESQVQGLFTRWMVEHAKTYSGRCSPLLTARASEKHSRVVVMFACVISSRAVLPPLQHLEVQSGADSRTQLW
jgi:hypothetical protein